MNDQPKEPQNNAAVAPDTDALAEANLWNPLWVYDLFPPIQCFWNRMPIVGADFQTESSTPNAEPNPEPSPSSDPSEQDNSVSPNNSDEENSSDEPGSSNSDNDDPADDEQPNEDDNNSDPSSPDLDDDDDNNDLDDDNDLDSDRDEDGSEELDPYDDEELLEGDSDPDHSNEYSLEEPELNKLPEIPGFTIIKTNLGTEYIREFTSWEDFVETAADDTLYAWKTHRESHNPNQATAGASATWNEAIAMARYSGWPKGRELLSDLLTNITQKSEAFDIWAFDVAGMFPIVPAYLSGDPACMIVDPGTDLRTQFPIIRIDYNHEVAWNITPKDMMIRGAAVLSLANNLEAHGFQTELRIIANCSGHNDTDEPAIFRYSIIYKKPGQFIDIDRAAFALAHPACMRRLGFALLEQHPELEAGFGSNYGHIMQTSNDPDSGSFGTIFIPGSLGDETEAKSRTIVIKAAKATTGALEAAKVD